VFVENLEDLVERKYRGLLKISSRKSDQNGAVIECRFLFRKDWRGVEVREETSRLSLRRKALTDEGRRNLPALSERVLEWEKGDERFPVGKGRANYGLKDEYNKPKV